MNFLGPARRDVVTWAIDYRNLSPDLCTVMALLTYTFLLASGDAAEKNLVE